MNKNQPVITGIGVVSPYGIGKEKFWKNLEAGKSCIREHKDLKYATLAGMIDDHAVIDYLGRTGLRNIDRSALMLMAAAGLAIKDAKLEINPNNTDRIGVSTGTTFSHIEPIVEFDREVFKEGISFASPVIFPATVLNAASSQVSIRYNIQGFNSTISTGFTSSLEALSYAINSIETYNTDIVLTGAVDPLSKPLLFGLKKLSYLSGAKNKKAVSSPFDAGRNGVVPGESAAMICIEKPDTAIKRKTRQYARILSVNSCFEPRAISKVYPTGDNIEKAVRECIKDSGIQAEEIDYISSCANSTIGLDKVEVKVLKRVFGRLLDNIPVSSIKSMTGETFSTAGALQIISCIGAMEHSLIPPTINYKKIDPHCEIDCVPNKARRKKVNIALVVSSGPGGYSSACLLEKM